ncbi:YciI family protein [Streptomyces sp. NPDC046203]|uniref:YciI family protein n=1 Tax=Streptomyces sp. NPDC046203 TaxID=3154602 RepID=UPI0033BFE866
MEFLCYHHDRPGSLPVRMDLLEAHWSYMDGFEKELIARGPTVAEDGETPTGSVHIVDLPGGPAAARAFAFEEPTYQAGGYRDVLLRRWRNLLGRTMWEFPGGLGSLGEDSTLFLVLGLGVPLPLDAERAPDLAVPADPGGDLIAYGPMLSDDGTTWLGTAAILRAPDAEAARSVLTASDERYAAIEAHAWGPGGRR